MGTIEHMVITLRQNRALRSKPNNNNVFKHKNNLRIVNDKFSTNKLTKLSKENKCNIKEKIDKERQ